MTIAFGKYRGRFAACVVLGFCAVALAAAASVGDVAVAATCPPPPSTIHPFVPWSDTAGYVLSTGGSFEAGQASWALTGGASVVDGNEPFYVDSGTDTRSLYLPPGSSATSACVTAPQIVGWVRFFATSSGASGGQLKVEVLVKGKSYSAGMVTAGPEWAPTPQLQSTAPTYKGAVTYQVRLTPVGTNAAFAVDDMYFDPIKSQ
jgi:hypothetical protein